MWCFLSRFASRRSRVALWPVSTLSGRWGLAMQDSTSPNSAANKEVEKPPVSRGRRLTLPQKIWEAIGSYVAVALGSVVGGVARYLASVLFVSQLGDGFPWSTLFVNVVGSFIIGFYAALTGPDGRVFATPRQRQFV